MNFEGTKHRKLSPRAQKTAEFMCVLSISILPRLARTKMAHVPSRMMIAIICMNKANFRDKIPPVFLFSEGEFLFSINNLSLFAKGIGIKPAAVVRLSALSGFFKAFIVVCAKLRTAFLKSSKTEVFCGLRKGLGIKPAAVVRLSALSGFFKALL